jgi:hypothetical protein
MTRAPRLRRRAFLRGSAGALLALPTLHAFAESTENGRGRSREEPVVPRRMVCIGTTYGFVPANFFPEEVGEEYALSPLLAPLAELRRKFTVFSQLDHGANGIGGHQGVHALLSGVLSKNARGLPHGNVTVDQVAAESVGAATRYPSLQFTTGSDPCNLLSWSRAGVAIPPVQDLRALHALLFQAQPHAERSLLQTLHREQISILDLVRGDADRMRNRISQEDRRLLDQYFTSVRDLERRLTQSAAWLDRPKPQVSYEVPAGANEMDFAERVPLYYDLITLALQTDSTRVITFELSELGGNLGGLPITRGYHQLTHHGKVESYLDELAVIETFQMQQFARFLRQLEAIPEPNGGTLLDNTITLLGSGMGNASSHSNKDLPLLLAGGGFRHGRHLRFEKDPARGTATPAANLFLSLLQRFGVETDEFNLATGTLNGLEVG